MTKRPTYLDALARAADWKQPPDEGTDTARPRPRSRYEPDGSDPLAAEAAWGETAIRAEAGRDDAEPTGPHSAQAAVAQQQAQPTITHPQPLTPSAEPAPPRAAEGARPTPSQPLPAETTARGMDRTAEPLEPVETAVRPAPAIPVAATREAPLAEPVVADHGPPYEPVGEPRTPWAEPPTEEPTDRPDPTPRHDAAPSREVTQEARPVERPVDLAPSEEPAPREAQVDPGPTIVVEIGRIEVRLASGEDIPARPTQIRPAPGPSLADYLRDRSAGAGRSA